MVERFLHQLTMPTDAETTALPQIGRRCYNSNLALALLDSGTSPYFERRQAESWRQMSAAQYESTSGLGTACLALIAGLPAFVPQFHTELRRGRARART